MRKQTEPRTKELEKEIARLTAENAELKRLLAAEVQINNLMAARLDNLTNSNK